MSSRALGLVGAVAAGATAYMCFRYLSKLRGEKNVEKGDALFEAQDYAGAKAAYDAAAALRPDDTDVVFAAQLAEEAAKGGVWIKQLRAGRDFSVNPADDKQKIVFDASVMMDNMIYLVGDLTTRECVIVDPSWDLKGVMAVARRHRMKVVGGVITHYHFDHAGGVCPKAFRAMMFGPFYSGDGRIDGVLELSNEYGAPTYVHDLDVPHLMAQDKQLQAKDIVAVGNGQLVSLGPSTVLEILHTPGHTVGSLSVVARERGAAATLSTANTKPLGIFAGDAIFIGKCGRLDLHGDPSFAAEDEFYNKSLLKLRELDDDLTVYPAHGYGGLSTTIGQEKRKGILIPITLDEWKKMRYDGDERCGSDCVAAAKKRAEEAK